MGRHRQDEMELEKRLQESKIFKDMTSSNFKEKIQKFLDNESPEQAKKDLQIFNRIQRRAKDQQLKREIERYDKYVTDTRVLTVLNEFYNASMEDRDKVLMRVIQVLNNSKNKYDKMKLQQKYK